MAYSLRFSKEASTVLDQLDAAQDAGSKARLKKVRKALGHLEQNPRHPSLQSHPYESFPVDRNVKVWDSYVENRTPSAWRIFWRYGPDEAGQPVITVLAITPHP